MENAILKKESDKLADEFEDIIRNHPDAEKSDISNMLMARTCLETINLPKNVAESYEKSDTVTIDPSQVKLEWELNDEEKQKYYRIRAYSFGPFDPIEYFKSKIKILWLLKEPYCECIDEINRIETKDYRQALQYSTWEKAKGNPTIANLIKYIQMFLKEMQAEEKIQLLDSDFANEDLTDMENVMKHICILEVNHFPGLAFNSAKNRNKSDDETANGKLLKWVEINENLIQKLLDFYAPGLIIGCQSFLGLFTPYPEMLNWFSNQNNNENSVYELEGKIYPNEICDKTIKKTWGGDHKHSMVKSEDGRYWINAYHPQQSFEKNRKILENNLKKFAKDICNDIMSNINKVKDDQ